MRGMNTNGQSLPQFLKNHKELTVQQILHAHLRISTHTLNDNKIRPLTDQELKTTVSAMLDLRPDVYAIHQKSKRLANLECTRAMNSSEDWEEKKDAETKEATEEKRKTSTKRKTDRKYPFINKNKKFDILKKLINNHN